MSVHLLDVNVLIALGWPNNKHHDSARRWFASIAAGGWATCPLTQRVKTGAGKNGDAAS